MSKNEPKVEQDRYTEDGVRMFNPTKPHGTIYADGFHEGRYTQAGVNYRADGLPVGYTPKAGDDVQTQAEPAKKPHWRELKKQREAQNAGASGAT